MDMDTSDTGSVFNFGRVSNHLPHTSPQHPEQPFLCDAQPLRTPQDVTNHDSMDETGQSNNFIPPINQSPSRRDPSSRPPDELNMITSRAKRPEYAMYEKRLETFHNWPTGHPLKPDVLARAGFFYAGSRDQTRCFYCGGAMSRWSPEDDVWVEHSRHFRECGYVKQSTSLSFRTVVGKLHSLNPKGPLTLTMVEKELGSKIIYKNPLLSEPAVMTLIYCGYNEADILPVAQDIQQSGESLTALSLYNAVAKKGVSLPQHLLEQFESNAGEHDVAVLQQKLEDLCKNSNDLRASRTCRVCLANVRTCVFQPCGHFACCLDCAQGVTSCPVCRGGIDSRVPCILADGCGKN